MPEEEGFITINEVEAIKKCKDKLEMKIAFFQAEIPTCRYMTYETQRTLPLPRTFPLVIKAITRSGGTGVRKVETQPELDSFFQGRTPSEYYLEEFRVVTNEYRIHSSPWLDSPIFAVEKVRRNTSSWIHNLENCVFKKDFPKPEVWEQMCEASKAAVKCLGLDFGACDVGYNNETQEFTIYEVNSACGMKTNTQEAYRVALNQIIQLKTKHLFPQ